MDKAKNSSSTLLLITFFILYFYENPLVQAIINAIFTFLTISSGVFIIRNSKRLAEVHMERYAKSSFQRAWGLRYRENPLRLTITLGGVSLIAIGLMVLVFASSKEANDAFEGFRRIVIMSAILIVISCGVTAVISAFLMLRRR